ncbi:MAG: hypothetical protein IT290_12330, partial [Deltaproteobacteria bacterium]|nr:hypothetical protein [Deltaproteobacteria bacterium]
ILLNVYWLGLSVFRSRAVGWFSALSLMGSPLFYNGHGVRTATQDPVMLLFMTLALTCGYWVFDRVRNSSLATDTSRETGRHVVAIGLSSGCAAATKSAAGFTGLIIFGSAMLLSGRIVPLLKRHLVACVMCALFALLLPLLYFLPHFFESPGIYNLTVEHEIVKRATVGYHHTGKQFFYYYVLAHHRLLVVPELLLAGSIYALFRILRREDTRLLYFLCWAFVPLLAFTAIRSRLEWYVMPAIPGMSIVIGAALGAALEFVRSSLRTPRYLLRRQIWQTAAVGVFLLCGAGALLYECGTIAQRLFRTPQRSALDLLAEHVRSQRSLDPRSPLVVRYKVPILSRDERFYLDMLGAVTADDPQEARMLVASERHPFLITTPERFHELAALRKVDAYKVLAPRSSRRQRMVLVSFVRELSPPFLDRRSRRIGFGDREIEVAFGSTFSQHVGGKLIRANRGRRIGFIVAADQITSRAATRLTLNAALNTTRAPAGARVALTINDAAIQALEIATGDFQTHIFDIPPGRWEPGKNLVMFELSRLDDGSVPDEGMYFHEGTLDILRPDDVSSPEAPFEPLIEGPNPR